MAANEILDNLRTNELVAAEVAAKRCRLVDGLPGTPCKTCGRIVVRKGSGRSGYHLTHAKPGEVVVVFPEATTGSPDGGGDVAIPAGSVGVVIRRLNDSALYVKVVGRSLVVWTAEVVFPPAAYLNDAGDDTDGIHPDFVEVDHDLCDRDEHLRRLAAGEDCPALTEPEVVMVERDMEDGSTVMPLADALAWLHSHGYALDVSIAERYLRDGGELRSMASTWKVVR